MKSAARAIAIMTSIALLLAVLAACNPSSQSSSSTTTLTVATVNNSQMVQMEQLTKQVFQKDHPNIKVNFVTLPENDLRSKVTQDVATNAGKFDVATIGSYETPIWAHNGWIQDLTPYFGKMSASDKSSYNYDDLLKPVMSTLSYQGHAYAVPFYGNLWQKYGEPGASTAGWQECLNLMTQGKAAMFYDATSFGGVLETPSTSKIAGNVGYAYGPTQVTVNGSHWLWAWSLGLVNSSRNKDAAFQFITWATSSQYLTLAGQTFGWANVPPGTRTSIYQNPNYQKAAPFAQATLDSINTATPEHPTLDPVPYHGVQYVGIPQFESVGQSISELMSAVVAGKTTVNQALQQSDQLLSSQVNKEKH